MLEPEKRLSAYLSEPERIRQVFALLADELARQEDGEFIWSITRTKPLLQSTLG